MKKILFLIHDLGQGGAEKVLVNLVNNMDPEKFDITVMALFGGGVNEQFLKPHIRLINCFSKSIPGNSKLMKLLTPRQLHKWLIKDRYDIEVAYLEGPSARVVSGCPDKTTKLVCWIHCTMHNDKELAMGFRTVAEAQRCYNGMDALAFVSAGVRDAFFEQYACKGVPHVLYNTNESEKILGQAKDRVEDLADAICLCGVGKLVAGKGFDRMIRVQKRLRDAGLNTCLYILGKGPQREELKNLAEQLGLAESVVFLGYQTNPYKYVAKCDLFVCASHAEGFSTAATEALIVGTPVCTVEVSGMKEMLGENNEYGVVTENREDALYEGIYKMLTVSGRLEHYKKQAALRGKDFSTEQTVKAVEDMLLSM